MQPAVVAQGGDADHPRHWLESTPLLDLDDPKLRLRVQSLTQLCTGERDKALAIYRFVKRMPVVKPLRSRPVTARRVLSDGRGDARRKATLAVAMLRIAGIPARVRWIALRGAILRGLTSAVQQVNRPLLEVWLDGGWQQTDTYIYDAGTMASARQILKDRGWDCGFGIHVDGSMLWDAQGSTFMGPPPDAGDPMFVADLGCYHDPACYMASPAYCGEHNRLWRRLQWSLMAPLIDRAWRTLRQPATPTGAPSRHTS